MLSSKSSATGLRNWHQEIGCWVASKDMVSLADLDNADIAGKQAMIETAVLAGKVMNALGDHVCRFMR